MKETRVIIKNFDVQTGGIVKHAPKGIEIGRRATISLHDQNGNPITRIGTIIEILSEEN